MLKEGDNQLRLETPCITDDTLLDLHLKTSILSIRVVEIWVLMGIREHPENCVFAILQSILKHRPTYRPCDVKRDFKAQFGVTVMYDKIWWGKDLAQDVLYGLARYSYDSLRL